MNVSELTGAMLDYWVARAEGYENERPSDGQMIKGNDRILVGAQKGEAKRYEFSPSRNWAQGGPIIERERIELFHQPGSPDRSRWSGKHMHTTGACYIKDGQTPLIAAMRAYVASKYGATVPDEEQCTDCQYEIEHDGKKVCRTMTRTHGQPCDAFKERDE